LISYGQMSEVRQTKDEIIRSIALKYGLEINEVEKAVKSQFHATAEAMKRKETSHVRYLGKFEVSEFLQRKVDRQTKNKAKEEDGK